MTVRPPDLEWSTQKSRRTENPFPRAAVSSATRHADLVYGFAKRDVNGRYRGSALGVFWSFFTPALMLGVYTFFFGVVFQARWPKMGDSTGEFALILFAGLLVFNLFSECVNKAPSQIVSNTNFVKRVIFPLEIFPYVSLLSGLFHLAVSVAVWLFFYILLIGIPQPTSLLLPVALVPLCLLLLGLSWFLSALGVFVRDVGQIVAPVTAAMMFLTPIFYPLEMLPPAMKAIVGLSPLTFAVESARSTLMWGLGLDWYRWVLHLVASLAVAAFGFAWFQKTRKGFADVL